MIDQLAIDYADKNIVYVDHDWPNPVPTRWDVIRFTEEGMGLTWAMVESGEKHSRGVETPEEAVEKYTAMTEYAIAKEALADVKAEYYIKDGMAYFKVDVKNLSDVTLSTENNASVHVFIKETGYQHATNTSHHAARGVGKARITSLAPNEEGVYYAAFPLRYIHNMENISAYAFVDYQTAPGAVYNQLNAAKATEVEPVVATISVTPVVSHILAPFGYETLRDIELTVSASEGVEWTASANQDWVQLPSSQDGDTFVLSFDKSKIHVGENKATIYFKDNNSDAFAFAQVSIWVEYDTGGWEKMVFPRIYFPMLNTK